MEPVDEQWSILIVMSHDGRSRHGMVTQRGRHAVRCVATMNQFNDCSVQALNGMMKELKGQ
jgi:hypothetical protein